MLYSTVFSLFWGALMCPQACILNGGHKGY